MLRDAYAVVILCLLGASAAEAQNTLTGHVLEAGSGAPREGVAVELRTEYNVLGHPASTYTDAHGRYQLEIPDGFWRLSARYEDESFWRQIATPAFVADSTRGFNFHIGLSDSSSIVRTWKIDTLPDEARPDSGRYRLEVSILSALKGEPVAEETFHLCAAPPLADTTEHLPCETDVAGTFLTDHEGRFVAEALEPGRYHIVSESAEVGSSQPFSLVTNTRGVLRLGSDSATRGFKAAGYVTDFTGTTMQYAEAYGDRWKPNHYRLRVYRGAVPLSPRGPLADAPVKLEDAAVSGRTDEDGLIVLRDLPIGTYTLVIGEGSSSHRTPITITHHHSSTYIFL